MKLISSKFAIVGLVILIIIILFINLRSDNLVVEGIDELSNINETVKKINDQTDSTIQTLSDELDRVQEPQFENANRMLHNRISIMINTDLFQNYDSDGKFFAYIKKAISKLSNENRTALLVVMNTFIKLFNDIKDALNYAINNAQIQ